MSARRVAWECLAAVAYDDAYANIVLPHLIRDAHLDARDAALATELSYGTLRMRGLYDAILSRASGRDARDLDGGVRIALWLGAHQMLSLRIPPHAAVDQTVALAKEVGYGRASGLVNAVMRRISEAPLDAWITRVAPGRDTADLAVRTSHPEWIVQELAAALTADGRGGDLEALLEADNVPPTVTLVARPGLMDRDALAAEVGGTPTRLSPWGVHLPGGDPARVAAVREGRAAVQDEGSQLAALALLAAPLDGPDERWLDMCAGPGGKTALLGARAAQVGAHVDAVEMHAHRARLVNRATRAVPSGAVTVHHADASGWTGGAPYDRILLDAPCTGLGAMRRRPESRWRRTPEDLADLVATQRRLLAHAASVLRPGGVLAYVTCSPVTAETRAQVGASGLTELATAQVLADALDVPVALLGREGNGPVQLWPHVHHTDAMFISLLTRPAA